MKRALGLAKRGLGFTSPNPPVGAVIVGADDSILGSGYHRRAGGPHAEIVAITNALKRHPAKSLKSSTLYITLEPCSTPGKTPACTDSIIKYGFSRVVYGCSDPNPDHQGRAKRLLTRKDITVTQGVLNKDCQSMIRFFTKHVTSGMPWLIAKTALTLDARTSLPKGQGLWITGKESLDDVQKLRSQVDAILIGGATLRADDPRLTLRGAYARKDRPQPWRIIVSRSGNLPSKSRVFTDRHRDRTLVFENKSLSQVLKALAKRGIQSVMMESGGALLGKALKANLIDEVIFYYAPIICGGKVPAIQLEGISRHLREVETKRLGVDLRISGLINHD